MTLSQRHDLGYIFSSSKYFKDFGHSRVDIMLCPTPTNKHFDPQRVYFMISNEDEIEHLVVTYKGHQLNKYRVVAGLVRIQDRKGKVVFAFTFGGELQIKKEEQEKICTLLSPAPILQFVKPTTIRFAEEVEILLAERFAEWESIPHEFETRLATVEPLALYAACLEYLIDKYKSPIQEDSMDLKHYLQVKLHALHSENELPRFSPPLQELI